ncbi:MAG: ATP synthase gamma chain [Syntrophorhabdaceae bacterium PtaU1.Bin034]|jgi:F-type H+-transporting ATPase subunit gamma|nr:MAG: ATP synthase gamma chain [Syntrophorhabdaceae bacterium PtaU1.Bin034]
MATLRDVKRKINSIRSTQTITRTMRMISASKLRRAQDDLDRVNGYALRTEELLKRMAGRIPENANPLLAEREQISKVLLFPIASDRGLSGAFNLNVATAVERFVEENRSNYEKIGVYVVGKKIRDYLKRRKIETTKEWTDLKSVSMELAQTMASDLTQLYLDGEFDKIYLIYTYFRSAIKQEVVFEEFLPLKTVKTEDAFDYLYEPDMQTIVDRFIPHYIVTKIYFALVESQTSEHAARMSAMENATNNCGEMIDYLTLVYNKTRQQSITNEMLDIVGGAEALQST